VGAPTSRRSTSWTNTSWSTSSAIAGARFDDNEAFPGGCGDDEAGPEGGCEARPINPACFELAGSWATLYYTDDYHWLSIAAEVAGAPWRLIVADPDNAAAGVRAVQRGVFGLIHARFGIDAAAYHVVSMILHAFNATLVFDLLGRLLRHVDSIGSGLKRLLAAFGAFVFVTTSLHAAAVIWMAAMSTLLVTAAVIVLFRYVLAFETRLERPRVQLGAVLLFMFALACKNTAVSFPLVLGAYLLVLSPQRRVGAGRVRLLVLLASVGIVQVLVTKLYIGRLDLSTAFGDAGAYALSTNVPLNILGAFMANLLPAATYEWLLPDLPYPYVAVPLLAMVLALFRSLPHARPALLGLTWLLAAALPVALFDYRQYSGEQVMSSRYYYLSHVGGCILMVFLVLAILSYARATRLIGAVVVVGAALHGALHLPALRAEIDTIAAHGASRMRLYESTLDAVQRRAAPGTEVYALGWPVPQTALPHIGKHFFAPHGITLLGPHDFELLESEPHDDGARRFVAYWDAPLSMLTVRPLKPSVELGE
jgi:hypothetical protein